jgi:glycosyltransferase involved in cell wall biosynthesis
MHIGFVCQFKPALVAPLLDASCRELAETIGGRNNTPVANIIPVLLERGHTLTIFAAEPSIPRPIRLSGPGLTLEMLPHRASQLLASLDHFRRERAALREAILKTRPDIVHGHWTQTGHALAALDSGLPAVTTVHDAALTCEWYNRGLRPDRILIGLERILMTRIVTRRSRHLIAVSPYVADHLRRVFGYAGDVTVIPNPMPFDAYAPLRAARTRRPDPTRPVFADVSAWGRIKNVSILLRAFRLVKDRIPDARLILIGPDLDSGGKGWTWAVRHALADGVEFRGPLSHTELLGQLATEVDVFVHLAPVESFGMALCEALALDIPVIASHSTGIPWTVSPLTEGLLRRAGDPEEVAAAMLRSIETGASSPPPAIRKNMEARFAPPVVSAQLEAVYARLLERA